MTFDAETFRHESAQSWSAVATGWATNRATFQAAMAPVSAWMLEALAPQPGHRVLELAAGPGDTGLMAAQRIRPDGTLICTDVAEEMLDAARARAQELGLDNVEFCRPPTSTGSSAALATCCSPTPLRRCARPAACCVPAAASSWPSGREPRTTRGTPSPGRSCAG
jgi:SAM-dependent methyltransferase